MRLLSLSWAMALASNVLAQNVTYCASGGVCYAVNVPASTASSGSGDIFLQMSGPSTMSWIGFGQGKSMTGANIFMMYANAAGDNVTVSPRLGVGNVQPKFAGNTSELTVLSGSGISNGIMTANVKCSNCSSWSGGTMSFTSAMTSWIWAYKSGDAIMSDSQAVNLAMHTNNGETTLNLQQAVGGASVNPFATTVAATTPASGTTAAGANGSESGESSMPSNYKKVLIAHGVLGPIAFAVFYPLGAMAIRLFHFKGLVWMHAGWMVFTYLIVLTVMGLGIWMAIETHQIGTYHPIIGLVVVGCLLAQPITGLAHHLLYKRVGRPNAATYPHVWWGRIIITLGIINGGLGLKLSDNTRKGEIAYGVVAGVFWLVWMGVIVLAFMRSRHKAEGESGDSVIGMQKPVEHGSLSQLRDSPPSSVTR